jgi:hypothetical protein
LPAMCEVRNIVGRQVRNKSHEKLTALTANLF